MTFKTQENIPDLPFAFPTYEDWLEVARQELEGADPTKKLTHKKGDLEILPFYIADETEPKNSPILKPSSLPYSEARSWINTPKILVTDEPDANRKALSYLNSGAEGILFDCSSREINPITLLNQISLPDCSVSFLLTRSNINWLQEFNTYAKNSFDKKKIRGNIFWSSEEFDPGVVKLFSDWDEFRALGIIVDSHQNASDELALALKKAVESVETCSEKLISSQHVFGQLSFSITIGSDFFLEIAKLKSLRQLWRQVKGAYHIADAKPLSIHAVSKSYHNEVFQPHGNMIHATTTAMAAIGGGCDSITIEPEDEGNETMQRIAINVSTILREESHFTKVADPTAGSYYIDALTNQLSEKAWKKFQLLVK
jgi:methylmalonyl-CoA mutase